MKKLYLYISLILVLSVNLYSCKEDETPVYPAENDEQVEVSEDKTEMTVSTEKIEVIKEQSKTLEIQSGNGDYKVSVLDNTIAEASVEGNIVIIKGLAQGETDIVISDKSGCFKNVKIDVYLTDNLIIDQTEVTIELPYGKPAAKNINIIDGNGGYVVSSANEKIVTANVDVAVPNRINLNATAEGETEVTITDCHGLSTKVSVKVTVNNSAFSSTELESIMAETEVQYVLWPDEDFKKKSGTMIVVKDVDLSGQYFGKKGDRHTGVYTRGNMADILLVTFTKDIGYILDQEEDGFLYVKRNRSFVHNRIPCKFKVIKKEGIKSWAVFYAEVDGGDIVKGYMIFE